MKRQKRRLKKTSAVLIAAMVLSGGSVAYAAESFSLTMMPTINTQEDSKNYTKSISASGAYAQITEATYNSADIELQVFKKTTSNEKAVTKTDTLPVSNRNSHTLPYQDNYGKQSFTAFMRAKHYADQKCAPYSYVTIKWNPNG